jgi:hypothetical protein
MLTKPQYPIYIPSKSLARAQSRLTARALERDNVPYYVVVEETEADEFRNYYPAWTILVLPFHDRGDGFKVDANGNPYPGDGTGGAVPARNWIRAHAEAHGHQKHWQLDDNLRLFRRLAGRQRIPCHAGVALRAVEDWSDRYTNVALTGINYSMMAVTGSVTSPIRLNHYVYSCTLINHDMPCRWRGYYNDDADICLQALALGWCTAQINVFLVDKVATMTMKGGMSPLYDKASDGRLKMSRSLERVWPKVVTTTRRFSRPQHLIADDWDKFDTQLILKPGLSLDDFVGVNEYGLVLKHVTESGRDNSAILSELKPFLPKDQQ